jgi:3-deoxy-D-manno-octulosonic-acid transferase
MLLFYRLSLLLYALAVRIASWFKPKARLFIEGRKDLLIKIKARMGDEPRPRIWMHCASLGEFEQGRPVLESLRKQYSGYAIVLTFFSPSGYQVRKKYEGADYIFYLPVDSASNAKQFVRDINPSLALFVKYDLWYYYLYELKKRSVPTVLIDAIFRPQQGYFRWYGSVQRQMLKMITHIFVQNEASAALLERIGIRHTSVAGDTRFDRVITVARTAAPIERFEALSRRFKLLIAGSTWAEDEQLLASVLPALPPDWKLIIVPHEVDEERISSVEKLFAGRIRRWSALQENTVLNQQVMVVDTIGLLLKIYRYGSIAWIGGGLGKGGVHNVLEAAVYGLPCAHGPVYEKYQEAVELVTTKASTVCSNQQELQDFILSMIEDKANYAQASAAAKDYVFSQSGATEIILHYLDAKNWLNTL